MPADIEAGVLCGHWVDGALVYCSTYELLSTWAVLPWAVLPNMPEARSTSQAFSCPRKDALTGQVWSVAMGTLAPARPMQPPGPILKSPGEHLLHAVVLRSKWRIHSITISLGQRGHSNLYTGYGDRVIDEEKLSCGIGLS